MKTVIATGGAGFIGSHTSLVLLQKGINLIVIDSLENSSEKAIEAINELLSDIDPKNRGELYFRKGDIRNYNWLNSIFIEFKSKGIPVEALIHFAGLKAVEESIKLPLRYWNNNVSGSINLLQVMKENDCRTIVFSSSATIYSSKDCSLGESLVEDSLFSPINPYGNTKLTIENILKDVYYSEPKLWKICNLRYFNPVGAHYSGKIGESPSSIPSNLFPYISQVSIGKLEKLSIFGNDWPTKDGTCIRDYIHIMDLAEAHYAALLYLIKEEPQVISLNIGTGSGKSVLEVVDTYAKVNQCTIPYEFVPRRKGDAAFVVANNQLALEKLDWEPKRNLIDMCRDAFKWQQLNPNGFNDY